MTIMLSGLETCTAKELIDILAQLPPQLAITATWEGQIVAVKLKESEALPDSFCLSVENF